MMSSKYVIEDYCMLQNGNTALHNAAYHGHLDVAALLIDNGCALNLTDIVSGM